MAQTAPWAAGPPSVSGAGVLILMFLKAGAWKAARRPASIGRAQRMLPGTALESTSAVGFAALRHIRTPGPVSPHFLFGWGAIRRQTSFRFDDTILGEQGESTWWGSGPLGGIGLDVPIGHFVARAQYRWNFRVEDSVHQFRIGFGWGS